MVCFGSAGVVWSMGCVLTGCCFMCLMLGNLLADYFSSSSYVLLADLGICGIAFVLGFVRVLQISG